MEQKENNSKIKSSNFYLEGPQSRGSELWFTLEVFWQFLQGFRKLHFVGPCITVFGSARFGEDQRYYKMAREMGQRIAKMGYTVMTGGGPGIMEAANRGAQEQGGRSIGCNIKLAKEQKPNPYMDTWVLFKHFFVRKVLLLKYSYAFVVMPGGFGTMDEFFETLTLVQTGSIYRFPIVIIGKEYYQPLMDYLDTMVVAKTIAPEDLKLVLLTDDLNEAENHIQKYMEDFREISKKQSRPRWWLLER